MAGTPLGSTVPRRTLGRHLRELRNRAGFTVRAAANELGLAESTIWRIEMGHHSVKPAMADGLCRVYGAPAELTQALIALSKETRARGWWHAFGDVIPADFDLYVSMEAAASELSSYESDLVPGLLQTADYARTILTEHRPEEPAEAVERRVHFRTERQALLRREASPPQLRLALSEAVLRRPVGGPATMAGQLRHLLEVSELPHVSIRVTPFAAGLHRGVVSGPFVVLRYPKTSLGTDSEPPTVFVEGYTGSLYLDKDEEVQAYDQAFDRIWGRSLDDEQSRKLIEESVGTHEDKV